MKEKSKKKPFSWQKCMAIIFSILLGVGCGLIIVFFMDRGDAALSEDAGIFSVLFLLTGLYVALIFQVIVHEAGHLVFGLLSGYRFSSFRIFNLMWIKLNGRIQFKRLSIAGTAGQCLMIPPEPVDGKFPVFLYNLGGPLLNLLVSLVFFVLSAVFSGTSLLCTILLSSALVGVSLAALNGIPMRLGMVNNDGYNAFALSRDSEALRSFGLQMHCLDRIVRGERLKDLPAEWFTLPDDDALKNSMTSVIGVFACNRLMDTHEFEEADRLMARLLSMDSGMIDLHRCAMIADRMFVEMITQNRTDVLETMSTKKQRSFMNQMKTSPSVLRVEFAWALLQENDRPKAGKIQARFDKIAKTYPYEADIQSERELMAIAQERAENLTAH